MNKKYEIIFFVNQTCIFNESLLKERTKFIRCFFFNYKNRTVIEILCESPL